jgi:hypothetical protein
MQIGVGQFEHFVRGFGVRLASVGCLRFGLHGVLHGDSLSVFCAPEIQCTTLL